MRENSVMFRHTRVGYYQKIKVKSAQQITCVCLGRVDPEHAEDIFSQKIAPYVRQVYCISQAYTNCYVAFAFEGMNKPCFEELTRQLFYFDKINILDPNDENLENCFPPEQVLMDIYLFDKYDEEFCRF